MANKKVQTYREIVAFAVESLPGKTIDWIVEQEAEARAHVLSYAQGFAKCRGVILSEPEIQIVNDEFDRLAHKIKERGV